MRNDVKLLGFFQRLASKPRFDVIKRNITAKLYRLGGENRKEKSSRI